MKFVSRFAIFGAAIGVWCSVTMAASCDSYTEFTATGFGTPQHITKFALCTSHAINVQKLLSTGHPKNKDAHGKGFELQASALYLQVTL